jgi:outer membrane protein assembly factor BamB
MVCTRRLLLVVLGIGLLTGLSAVTAKDPAPVMAQRAVRKAPPPPGAPAEPGKETEGAADAIHLPTNADAKRLLGVARDYITEEAWGQAANVLQALIDMPEDAFVEVKRKGPDGKEKTSWQSIRVEANRLIGTMPAQGIQFYELRNGGRAKALLSRAKDENDKEALAQIAFKYLYTDAGAEATELLGTYHLDRGHDVAAAVCFEKLLRRQGDKAGPLTLFKACLAFRRAADPDHKDEQLQKDFDVAWKLLAARAPGGIEVGDERVALDRLRQLLARAQPVRREASVFDWLLFRGDAKRNAHGKGGTLFREPRWTMSLLPEFRGNKEGKPWVETYLKRAVQPLESRGVSVMPGFFPIAAGGKIIYRSYEGMYAINPKKDTDQLEWYARLDGALGILACDTDKKLQMGQWCDQFYIPSGPHNVLFNNSMVGTISSDNVRVYVVDDMALPPHPMIIQQAGFGGGQAPLGKMQELANHSVLDAFDLESGKILWDRGARDKDDLAGTYFLGPPLPLGGKLYVLNEKAQELRLVCLDAARGDTVWTQTLATARDRILLDIGRRVNAAHLAYADGILVCPTNAGAVLGVDLLTHSLIWAYPYREGSPVTDHGEAMIRRGRFVAAGMMPGQILNLNADTWQACAPIIFEGKVVLTAPDGGSVRCVSLRDGMELWRANRENDLYAAGVYNTARGAIVLLVGKSATRALDLAHGKPLWQVDTGLPSGHGVASGNKYYLPIKSDPQDSEKKPAVVVIDLDLGKDEAHTMARSKDAVFGNLLFYEGDVISQNLTEISAYPQMDVKLALITKSLARDPKNPVGLIERGELRLDKGELPGALEDLRAALANKPPADMVPKARGKLYEALSRVFREPRDFTANEMYLPEFEELCKVDVPKDALPEERQRAQEEERRRRSNFLYLTAKGREAQGRLLDAFRAYQEFGALAGGGKELISVPDDLTVKARPDVWAQGRIAAMMAKATPEQRRPLEDKIAADWKTVEASGDLTAVRRFVDLFGSLFQSGREARLVLAERLMKDKAKDSFLDAELQLQQLRQLKDDPKTAARAVEALARLMIQKELLEDAAYYYRELGRDYADVPVREGKTGADFYNELVTDKRFLPYLGGVSQPWKGVRLKEDPDNPHHGRYGHQPVYTFTAEGERTPFFQHHRLVLEQNGFVMRIIDQDTGQDVWRSPPLTPAYYLFQSGYTNLRFTYHARGHLVVFTLGTIVYAFDPVDHRKLWQFSLSGDLSEGPTPPPGMGGMPAMPGMGGASRIAQDKDGNLQLIYTNGDILRLGQTGPVEASYVCLQTRDGLVALEPRTGKTLWTRSGVPTRSHVFGDAQYVYVADHDAGGNVTGTRALRAHDGVTVDLPPFTEAFKNKSQVVGRNILWGENDSTGLVLHLHDVAAGKDVWKKALPASSKVLHSVEPTLAGAADPDGTCTILDLAAGKELGKLKMAPEDVRNASEIHLVADPDRFYLAVDAPLNGQKVVGGLLPNAMHMRAVKVNGNLYAYDRTTGKLCWDSDGKVEHQMLLLEQFQDLPVVILTAQYRKANGPVGNPFGNMCMGVLVFDKREGACLLQKEYVNGGNQFFALNANLQEKTIELQSFEMRVRLVLDANGGKRKAGRSAVQKPVAPRLPTAVEYKYQRR